MWSDLKAEFKEVWGYTAVMWLVIGSLLWLLSGSIALFMLITVLCALVGIAGSVAVIVDKKLLDRPSDDA